MYIVSIIRVNSLLSVYVTMVCQYLIIIITIWAGLSLSLSSIDVITNTWALSESLSLSSGDFGRVSGNSPRLSPSRLSRYICRCLSLSLSLSSLSLYTSNNYIHICMYIQISLSISLSLYIYIYIYIYTYTHTYMNIMHTLTRTCPVRRERRRRAPRLRLAEPGATPSHNNNYYWHC